MSEAVTETRSTFPKSVQPGIPRVNPTPSGATRYSFGDLFEVVKRPVKLNDDEDYDLVTVKRARGGIVPRARMKGAQVAVKSQFYLEEDDFLISKRQIVHGACGIVSKDFSGSIVSNEYSVLRCNSKIDLQYLGYLSHSIYFQQTCFHSSIGVHIEKMIFKLDEWFKWPINIPSLPEQKKIATFLGVVDAKLAALRDRVALLERYKRGLMQALFSQSLRFTKPDGTAFPDWEEKRLGEVAKKTSSSVTAQSIEEDAGEFPVYGASGYLKCISSYASESEHISIVKDGAGVGRLFLCPRFSSVLGTLDSIVANGKNHTRFVYYWLSLVNFEPFITGSTIPHIYFRDYSKLVLLLPHPDEQQKIAEVLSAIDAKIAAGSDQVAQMEQFKKGLLQQMFV